MLTSRLIKAWSSVAVVLTLATLYTRHHLSKFERRDWGQELYIEDSRAGAWDPLPSHVLPAPHRRRPPHK
jgi:hypothetical protein